MSGPPNVVSPSLLAKARTEIDAMVTGMVPEGKQGAIVSIFDQSGVKIGGATKLLGDDLIVDFAVVQRWKKEKPTAQVRVTYTW